MEIFISFNCDSLIITLFKININSGTYFYTGERVGFYLFCDYFPVSFNSFPVLPLDLNAGGCANDNESNC
jgi:hypothetical protein